MCEEGRNERQGLTGYFERRSCIFVSWKVDSSNTFRMKSYRCYDFIRVCIMISSAFFPSMLIVRNLSCPINCRRSRVGFDIFTLSVWYIFKGSVGVILVNVSTMRLSIPLDLSSRLSSHFLGSSVLTAPPLFSPLPSYFLRLKDSRSNQSFVQESHN